MVPKIVLKIFSGISKHFLGIINRGLKELFREGMTDLFVDEKLRIKGSMNKCPDFLGLVVFLSSDSICSNRIINGIIEKSIGHIAILNIIILKNFIKALNVLF